MKIRKSGESFCDFKTLSPLHYDVLFRKTPQYRQLDELCDIAQLVLI